MKNKFINIALVALAGVVTYPKIEFGFRISGFSAIGAIEFSMSAIENKLIFVTTQKDIYNQTITEDSMYLTGTISKIVHVSKLPDNSINVLFEGQSRAYIKEFTRKEPFYMVDVENIIENEDSLEKNEDEDDAILRMIHELFEKYSILSGKIPPDIIMEILSAENIGYAADLIAARLPFKISDKQNILEKANIKDRIISILHLLEKEINILNIQKEINLKVHENINISQREYYLKEQLKIIQDEIGNKDGILEEINNYKEKAKKVGLPCYAEEKIEKELVRLKKMSLSSAEGTVSRDYIELVLELPWSNFSEENKDLKKAQDILNEDHYGLDDIKERIIEFLAVKQQISNNINSPILCFVGPPGVGKTSIVKSIANSLNRKYIRISLGGVHDEAEIRGHRKTYVGAMPGRIISSLKQVGTNNPVILLDEIDKLSSDFKGNPTAALLEVLDSEQNFSFADHYLEIPFDISKVMFVCTANSLYNIPSALKDRLEVINLSSYTDEEKFNIAEKFLLPKQIQKHGIKKSNIRMKSDIIKEIITYYTKESGVRQLERCIEKVCRKTVKAIFIDEKKYININSSNISVYLGEKKYKYLKIENKNYIGVVRGLAYTNFGGDTLSIEANTMKGNGKIELTGNIGKIMQESAKAALSYIRANCGILKIKNDFYENMDIHLHIPEGAIPKDGPSAGITIAIAMISAIKKIPISNNIAMTGEITLRGIILPIGGLKEKTLAAKKVGITKIIVPYDNLNDLKELPQYCKTGIEFILAENMNDVLKNVFCKTNTNLINANKKDDNIYNKQ